MTEQIILREYQKTDHQALEHIVWETWKYDRFCSPKTAAKMSWQRIGKNYFKLLLTT